MKVELSQFRAKGKFNVMGSGFMWDMYMCNGFIYH